MFELDDLNNPLAKQYQITDTGRSAEHKRIKQMLIKSLNDLGVYPGKKVGAHTLIKWTETLFFSVDVVTAERLAHPLAAVYESGLDNVAPNTYKENFYLAHCVQIDNQSSYSSRTSTFYFSMALLNDIRLFASRTAKLLTVISPIMDVVPPQFFVCLTVVLYPIRILIDLYIIARNALFPTSELQKNLSFFRRAGNVLNKDGRFGRLMSNIAWFTDICLSYTILGEMAAMHLSIGIAVAFMLYSALDDYRQIKRFQALEKSTYDETCKHIAREKIASLKSNAKKSAGMSFVLIGAFALSLYPPTALLGLIVALCVGIYSTKVRIERFSSSRSSMFSSIHGARKSQVYQDQYSLDPSGPMPSIPGYL